MVHVLFGGDIAAGEAITEHDVVPLRAYRIKTKTGHYVHVLADSADALQKFLDAPAANPALDRMGALELELAALKAQLPTPAARPATHPQDF